MTRDGRYVRYGRDIDSDKEAMQEKIKGHSNIVVLVKTKENKIFGGYTSSKIEYKDTWRIDNKAFLFSIDLNEKFNIKENGYVIRDNYYCGIKLGNADLILLDDYQLDDDHHSYICYSFFGSEYSYYENNGITRDEFLGGIEITNQEGLECNIFTPIEIEVFEIKK